jgi:2-phosphosulfolactate phosphatase
VIDVLRATSTLTHAFAAGASEALFYSTAESAVAARRRYGEKEALLCGEREGVRIAGFDLGNSPLEYGAETVGERTLLFASTNGSLAFLATAEASVQWAVAFVNLDAAVRRVAAWVTDARSGAVSENGPPEIEVVCAGKLGEPAIEDSSCAARLIERLTTRLASAGWETEIDAPGLPPAPVNQMETLEVICDSPHGRYLRSLGSEYEADLEVCAAWDSLTTVPTGSRARLLRSETHARGY